MFEYVIVLYNKSVVTTVIGFADLDGALTAFHESCKKNNAQWAYMMRGDGALLGTHGVPQ